MLIKLLQAFPNKTEWNLGDKNRTCVFYLLSKQAAQDSPSPPRGARNLIDFSRNKALPLCVARRPSAQRAPSPLRDALGGRDHLFVLRSSIVQLAGVLVYNEHLGSMVIIRVVANTAG